MQIDKEAKAKIDLIKREDDYGNIYYIAEQQQPGVLSFKNGISFMVFTEEEGNEQIHIGPLDHEKNKRKPDQKVVTINGVEKTRVNLHPVSDRYGSTIYVGEAHCPTELNVEEGLFFTVFTAKKGKEELQISKLDTSKRKPQKISKLKIDMLRRKNDLGDTYYIGKLQFPFVYDFEHGVSFIFFNSEEDNEQLHLGLSKEKSRPGKLSVEGGKVKVPLDPTLDGNGDIIYVQGISAPIKVDAHEGLFFIVFVSKEGNEEVQISRLNPKRGEE